MYDVIVVGGGIIGSSIAWQLSKRGKQVLVLERKDSASGSAGATDGFVGCHTKKPGPQLELAQKSIAMFDEILDDLGPDIDYEVGAGGMQPVEDEVQWNLLSQMVEKQQKSAQREHDRAQRGDWGAVKPTLRVVESKKKYRRARQKEADRREEGT